MMYNLSESVFDDYSVLDPEFDDIEYIALEPKNELDDETMRMNLVDAYSHMLGSVTTSKQGNS